MADKASSTDLWQSMSPLERDLLAEAVLDHFAAGPSANVDLFHYTSPEAFCAIVHERAIWLTNAAYLNDQGELSYPVSVCRDVLAGVSERENDEAILRFIDQVAREVEMHIYFKHWFVGSFSTCGDLLSQWRAYCPNGGYALGFNSKILLDGLPNSSHYSFGPVLYDRSDQVTRITSVMERYLGRWRELRIRYAGMPQEQFNSQMAYSLRIALSREFVFIKSPAFYEEHEWRIARHTEPGDTIKFRERRGLLTPYVDMPLVLEAPLLPISEVFISPLVDTELAVHSATLFLRSEGYRDVAQLIKEPNLRLRF